MPDSKFTRRDFLKTSTAVAVASTPYWYTSQIRADEAPKDKPLVGAIGLGNQGTWDTNRAAAFANIVALCDVDAQHAERAREKFNTKAEIYGDYRKLLDRKDIEAVIIGTPDHWHTAPALAALDAGKHVYCEKPLTLTIDEGKQLVDKVKRSGRVMQVGTQQRGDQGNFFGRAVATARSGQMGKIKRITVQLPLSCQEGGPFEAKPVPENFDWDMWLGQAPKVDYCPERCHSLFRWWFEYSGGVVTDWGAHHMDIAHWVMDCETSGPLTIDGSKTKLPNIPNGFNTPKLVTVDFEYPNDVQVLMRAQPPGDEGLLIEGEKGRIFVNRGRITGGPIEEQDKDPALKQSILEGITKLYKGNTAHLKEANGMVTGDHMQNFFDAWREGKWPISDVVSQHRSVSACHLANISIRLGRKLKWDADKETFGDDNEANGMLTRVQREPYQIKRYS